jgi:hypothetical protein
MTLGNVSWDEPFADIFKQVQTNVIEPQHHASFDIQVMNMTGTPDFKGKMIQVRHSALIKIFYLQTLVAQFLSPEFIMDVPRPVHVKRRSTFNLLNAQ